MSNKPLELNLYLLGFGNVGRAFYQLVFELRERIADTCRLRLDIAAVSDSSGTVNLRDNAYNSALISAKVGGLSLKRLVGDGTVRGEFTEPSGIGSVLAVCAEQRNTWVIDTTPSDYRSNRPAERLISLLENGIPAVTANKSALVNSFGRVMSASESLRDILGSRGLGYTAATGLTSPSVSKLAEAVGCASIVSIEGILNGTSGYILSQMQGETESESRVKSYDEALQEARSRGIAEADPALDVEGWDTAAKLVILASTLFGREAGLADVERMGIDILTADDIAYAVKSGSRICLIGRCETAGDADTLSLKVCPELLGTSHPLYNVMGTEKALVITSDLFGSITIRGGRSGTRSTAAVMLNDLVQCCGNRGI